MADQSLNIRVRIGTQGGESVLKFANEIEGSTKRQTKLVTEQEKLEKQLAFTVKEQASYFKQLEANRKAYNADVKAGLLSQSDAFYSLQAETQKYNVTLAETKKKINDIKNDLKAIQTGKDLGTGALSDIGATRQSKDQKGFSFVSGAGGASQAKLQDDFAKVQVGRQAEIAAKDYALVEAAMQKHKQTILANKQELETQLTSMAERKAAERRKIMENELLFAEEARKRELAAMRKAMIEKYPPLPTADAGGKVTKQQKDVVTASNEVKTAVIGQLSAWNRLKNGLAGIIVEYRAINAAYNLFLNALYSVPRTGIQLESTIASLTATTGSLAGATRELQFLNQEAFRTGIAVSTLRESYANVAASFILAGESAENTRRIFQNINTVATTLHLSTDRVQGVFLALSQMFNKGKVQAEELTKQLSQTLPGITNQTAKALGLSAAQLGDAMKKGLITAKDAVLKMSEQIAQAFGGEAFTRAASGLNAELGRLSTNWTLFAENLYKVSEGSMKYFVKMAADVMASLRGLTDDTIKFGEALDTVRAVITGLIIGAGFAALSSRITAFGGAMASARTIAIGLTGTLTTLWAIVAKHPFVLLATGVAIAADKLYLAKQRAEETSKTIQDIIEQQKRIKAGEVANIDLSTNLRPEDNALVKQREAQIKAFDKETQELLSGEGIPQEAYKVRMADRQLLIESSIMAYGKALEEAKQTFTSSSVDLSKEMNTVEEEFLRNSGDLGEYVYKKHEEELNKFIEATKNGDVQAKKALEQLAYNMETEIETLRSKKVKSNSDDDLRNAKDNYKEINAQMKTMLEDTKSNLEIVDDLYQQNIISFEEYYRRKKETLAANLESELSFQREIIKIASSAKDTPKATEASEKIEQIRLQYQADLVKLEKDRFQASIANTEVLKSITLDYYAAIGDQEAVVKQQLEDKYILIKNSLREQVELGNSAKLQDLERIAVIEKIGQAEAKIVRERELIAANDAKYEQNINRINILKNIGSISELTAARELAKFNEEFIKNKEEAIRLEKQRLESFPINSPEFKKVEAVIAKAKAELEDFKLTADTVAVYFDKILGDAFERAFEGFATGAMNAQEAFNAFTTSLIADIAKIAAQEVKSALIGGLFSSSGGQGGLLSTLFKGITASADGNVTSGITSGTVLTSPTYFPSAKVIPFASGGVLAGEAGAEAVLPLKRGRGGKLGVTVEGNSSGGNVININVAVDRSSGEDNIAYATRIAETIAKRVAKEEIANAARPGNINNRVTKFG